MRSSKIVALVLALCLLPLAGAFARAAGGFTWGEQYGATGPSNVDLGASTVGVYGYDITWGGQRYGGFAMALHSNATQPALEAGFIGGLAGQEMRIGPLVAAVTLWSGFGGMNSAPLDALPGTLALFGEVSLELGFGFLPGVLVTGYAGMQVIAPVLFDQGTIGTPMYTPVLGVRVAWGG